MKKLKGGVLRTNKGFSILDILIVILLAAVIAALVTPKLKKDKENENRTEAREKMMVIAAALDEYFLTANGTFDIESFNAFRDSVILNNIKIAPEDTLRPARFYTDDFANLSNFLPEGFENSSPPNGKNFMIFSKDSSYYVIYDPNGYGTVLNGKPLWME